MRNKVLTVEDIQLVVSKVTGYKVIDFLKVTRKRELVQVRQLSMYFCKKETNLSLATIGEKNGNKDHATVLHAIKAINDLYVTCKYIKDMYNKIDSILSLMKINREDTSINMFKQLFDIDNINKKCDLTYLQIFLKLKNNEKSKMVGRISRCRKVGLSRRQYINDNMQNSSRCKKNRHNVLRSRQL